MKIIVLGNGSFTIDKDHSGPGYLIQTKEKNILIDCGPGVQSQLADIGFDPYDLDYIFITHLHSDHVSDLFALLARIAVGVRFYGKKFDHKLTLIGPDLREYILTLANLYTSGTVKNFENFAYKKVENEMEFDDFKVRAYKVNHLPDLQCFAYKFEIEGKTIVFSGDTNYSDGIIEAAKNADLLIADCGVPKGKGVTGSHMSSTEVGKLCKKDNVKKVILSHILPPGYNADLVSETREEFDGEILLAKKLMEIEL
jgi:ribonuclease BN (tRNA processing enzyme)